MRKMQKINRSINQKVSKYISQFCNGDLNKFVLLLQKGIHPYEDMDNRGKFDETIWPPKEAFYNNLNLENISDEDYVHAQKVWEVFEIKNLGEYHALYVQSDTLLLADVFKNFRNMCLEIYELDPTYFVSVWQACLKKTGVKLELIIDYDMLLMIKKGLGVEFFKKRRGMLKKIINIWKIMIKTMNHHI